MILAIVGPTGVGKTKLSIELAKKYNAIVINCDAMQVYKNLDIGTAKITEEEKEDIPHFLFDICEVTENYTVYNYQHDLRNLLKKYENKNVIIVGGTGLYLKAALYDYRFNVEDNSNQDNYDNLSNAELYELALKKDSNMNIHPNNRQRLIRFLNKSQVELVEPKLLYDVKFIGLTTNRENLYDIINKRVDKMFKDGLLEEVKKLYKQKNNSQALQTAIGYKELFDYLDNKISLDEAKELIKLHSRRYAKRQYTWFNNQMDVKWFDVDYQNFANTIKEVENYLNSE